MRFALLVALLTLAFAALVIEAARAQSPEELRAWIHANGRECCPHQNCFAAPLARVGPLGWTVPGMTGTLSRARVWPFAETYACFYPHDPARRLRCVFHRIPEAS